MRTARLAALFMGLVVLVFVPSTFAAPPQPVSPGGADVALVEARCPTFSWAPARPGAVYELAVYAVARDGELSAEPVLSVRLPPGAGSWTPSLDQRLERGGLYAWSIREVGGGGGDGHWSEPMVFEVAAAPTLEEVEEALATLRRFREAAARASDSSDPGRPAARSRALSPSFGSGGSASTPAIGASLAPKAAPTLGQASLSLSSHLSLAPGSAIFQDGTILLWSNGTSSNTSLGHAALSDPALSGEHNTALGNQALRDHETGGYNTAVGFGASILNVDGSNNTALGAYALAEPTSGSNNLGLGDFAGNNLDGGSENIMIANDGTAGDSYVIRIGSLQTETHIAGIHGASLGGSTVKRVCVDETDQLGPCPPTPASSSQEMVEAEGAVPSTEVLLEEIRKLREQVEKQQRRLETLEGTVR